MNPQLSSYGIQKKPHPRLEGAWLTPELAGYPRKRLCTDLCKEQSLSPREPMRNRRLNMAFGVRDRKSVV